MKTLILCAALLATALPAMADNPLLAHSQTPASTAVPNAVVGAPEKAAAKAPAIYKVDFKTTKGDFVIEVHRDWAPNGADRFYNLVKLGFYNDVAFFRAIQGFMVQFGISGSPEVNAKWVNANIPDDPPTGHHNQRGYVTFATAGPNTRTTQIFINYADNSQLDSMGFTPFGIVTEGMDTVVDRIYNKYGEGAPSGTGPSQGRIQSAVSEIGNFPSAGNAYLKKDFPKLDYVKTAAIEKEAAKPLKEKTQPETKTTGKP